MSIKRLAENSLSSTNPTAKLYNLFALVVTSRAFKKRPGDRLGRMWMEIIADALLVKCEKGDIKAVDLLYKIMTPPKEVTQKDVVNFMLTSTPDEVRSMLNLTEGELAEVQGKFANYRKDLLGEVDSESDKTN